MLDLFRRKANDNMITHKKPWRIIVGGRHTTQQPQEEMEDKRREHRRRGERRTTAYVPPITFDNPTGIIIQLSITVSTIVSSSIQNETDPCGRQYDDDRVRPAVRQRWSAVDGMTTTRRIGSVWLRVWHMTRWSVADGMTTTKRIESLQPRVWQRWYCCWHSQYSSRRSSSSNGCDG